MLEKQLGVNIPAGLARAQFLSDNCHEIENVGYVREFAPEEMEAMKDNLADTSITVNDLEIEKKEKVKEITDKIKPLKNRLKGLLTNIRERSEFVKEDCYKFIDHEENQVGYYNSDGLLISTRRAKPEERQTKMFVLDKTGTNN